MGWKTVWISPNYNNNNYEFIDHSFPSLKMALDSLAFT